MNLFQLLSSLRKAPSVIGEGFSALTGVDERFPLDAMREAYHETYDPAGKTADVSNFIGDATYYALNPVGFIMQGLANPVAMNPSARRFAQREYETRRKPYEQTERDWETLGEQVRVRHAKKLADVATAKKMAAKRGVTLSVDDLRSLMKASGKLAGAPDRYAGNLPSRIENPAWPYRRSDLFDPSQFEGYRTATEGPGWKQKEDQMMESILKNLEGKGKKFTLTGGF